MSEREPQSSRPRENPTFTEVLAKYSEIIKRNVSVIEKRIVDPRAFISEDFKTISPRQIHRRVQIFPVLIYYNVEIGQITDKDPAEDLTKYRLFSTILEITTDTIQGNSLKPANRRAKYYKLRTIDKQGNSIFPQKVYSFSGSEYAGQITFSDVDRVVLYSIEQFNQKFTRPLNFIEDFFSNVIDENPEISVEVLQISIWQSIHEKLSKLFGGN